MSSHDTDPVDAKPAGAGPPLIYCQSFFTAPRRDDPYGPGHRNVLLSPQVGMIVLDVIHGRIMFVEVLDHPPLRKQGG